MLITGRKSELRLLEGEPVQYRGVIWIVKGEQHPPGYLVAYPRYDLMRRDKLSGHERNMLVQEHLFYWNCLDLCVPIIPLHNTIQHYRKLSWQAEMIKIIMEQIIGDLGEVIVSGSSIIMRGNDVDLVIYTVKPALVVKKIKESRGVLIEEAGTGDLYREWLLKHKHVMSFQEYLGLKKNSILHIKIAGWPVSLRIVPYRHGFSSCINPVFLRRKYSGYLEIIRALSPYTTPARFLAKLQNGENIVLETRKILYAELQIGRYFLENGYIEVRKNGKYVIPDHGILHPVNV